MGLRFLFVIVCCVFVFQNAYAFPQNNSNFAKTNFENSDTLFNEKYSYNEPEKEKTLIKSKYDIEIGESQLSVGIKGFSLKFPVFK